MGGERPTALRDEAGQRDRGLKAYWPGRHRLRDGLVPDRRRRGTELARPRKQIHVAARPRRGNGDARHFGGKAVDAARAGRMGAVHAVDALPSSRERRNPQDALGGYVGRGYRRVGGRLGGRTRRETTRRSPKRRQSASPVQSGPARPIGWPMSSPTAAQCRTFAGCAGGASISASPRSRC
jgi:hypothetical protein